MRRVRFVSLLRGVVALAVVWLGVASVARAHDGSAGLTETSEQPTIEQDVEDLRHFHNSGKRAAYRLAEHGEAALPQLHAALLSPTANDKQLMQICRVLAEIGDPSSATPIVKAAKAHPDMLGVRKQALRALSQLPPADGSFQFVSSVLDDPQSDYKAKIGAVEYFAQNRDERGLKYVAAFADHPEPDLRVMSVYLAARLGRDNAEDTIVTWLAGEVQPSVRYALLMAFAEVAGPDELQHATPTSIQGGWEYGSARRLAIARTSSDEALRERLSLEMMTSPAVHERLRGAKIILDDQGPEKLATIAGYDITPPARSAARKSAPQGGLSRHVG
jgi:HEAT repeat protein